MNLIKLISSIIISILGLTNSAFAMTDCALNTDCVFPSYGVYLRIPVTEKANYHCYIKQKENTSGFIHVLTASSYDVDGDWVVRDHIELSSKGKAEGYIYFTDRMLFNNGFLVFEVDLKESADEEENKKNFPKPWPMRIPTIVVHCKKIA